MHFLVMWCFIHANQCPNFFFIDQMLKKSLNLSTIHFVSLFYFICALYCIAYTVYIEPIDTKICKFAIQYKTQLMWVLTPTFYTIMTTHSYLSLFKICDNWISYGLSIIFPSYFILLKSIKSLFIQYGLITRKMRKTVFLYIWYKILHTT